ncbi:nucleotidyltransferase family protein [candidate division KSB1 bacterium]
MDEISGSPFPNIEQEYLLQAALFKDESAVQAWEIWKKSVDLEGHLDPGSFRCLPLLYKNLLHHRIKDPFMTTLKGVYRQAWYKNQKLIYDSSRVIQLLHDAGIKTLILKGVALSIQVYNDYGTRPMADIDVLIPRNKARNAIDLLKKDGWKPEYDEYIEYNLRYGRSMQFTDESGLEFDLHWHPFFESHENSSDNDFWDVSESLTVGDIQTLSLCPADTLLHVIVHGLRFNPEPPIRWIPDAYTLIHNSDKILDWNRLVNNIKKYKIVLQFRDAFSYLNDKFNANIPEKVIEELQNIPVTYAERLVYKYSKINTNDIPNTFFNQIKKLFAGYLRQSNKKAILWHLPGFLKYLKFRTSGKGIFRLLLYYISLSLNKQKRQAIEK